ncbi:MAG: ABC transporter permease [Planctomycetales bacterium]|nr:ABC transporter permease [Planctomycetales bacterium]
MTAYIIRRLMYLAPIVFGVLLVTFVLFTLIGGDISQQIAGKHADAETIAEIRHEYGFDKPLFVGHKPLEGDEAVWESEKEGFILALKNERRTQMEEKAARKAEKSGSRTIEPVKEPQIAEYQAKKEWLSDLFWKRVRDKQSGQAWEMVDFDSQFVAHFTKAFTFRFGRALDRERIGEKILRGIGPSVSLTIPMFFGTLIVSISFALVVAFLRGTVWDHAIVILCVAGMSLPYLSFIIFGQYFFAYRLDWFPIFYAPDQPMGYSVVLPAMIGMVAGLGSNLRFYRTIMLDEIRNDYVRTAFAKGLTARRVLFKHVLKNAMIPIVTSVVLSIPYLILGSLLLERFFGIPGLGYLMFDAVSSRDFFVLNALTFIEALLIAFFTLVADVCYAWVDPRVKFD